jgi:hypothetical protein
MPASKGGEMKLHAAIKRVLVGIRRRWQNRRPITSTTERIVVIGSLVAVALIAAWLTPLNEDQMSIGFAIALGIWLAVRIKSEQVSEAKIAFFLAVGAGFLVLPIILSGCFVHTRCSLAAGLRSPGAMMLMGGGLIVIGLVTWSKKTLAKFFHRH